jgi:hypothetical protein
VAMGKLLSFTTNVADASKVWPFKLLKTVTKEIGEFDCHQNLCVTG